MANDTCRMADDRSEATSGGCGKANASAASRRKRSAGRRKRRPTKWPVASESEGRKPAVIGMRLLSRQSNPIPRQGRDSGTKTSGQPHGYESKVAPGQSRSDASRRDAHRDSSRREAAAGDP